MRIILNFILLALTFGLTACKSTGPKFDPYNPAKPAGGTNTSASFEPLSSTNKIDPAWLKEPTDFFKLGPGDIIQIEIAGQPRSRGTVSVGPDGKIYYSLLSATSVWGLTLSQTKALLEDSLGKFIRVKPEVEVDLVSASSKQIWVLGQVKAPGLYPLVTPLTVLGAISAAKGVMAVAGTTEETVDLARSFIMREGQLLSVDLEALLRRGDLSQNIYLMPDDFIYLKPAVAKEIYILGAVGQSTSVAYFNSISLVSAIATVGGPVQYAYKSRVAIIRGSLTHPSIAFVDYKAIVHGDLPDIPLEPGDIIYVPLGPFTKALQLGDAVLAEFVRGVAINEGANLVSERRVAVPISVPVYTAPAAAISTGPGR